MQTAVACEILLKHPPRISDTHGSRGMNSPRSGTTTGRRLSLAERIAGMIPMGTAHSKLNRTQAGGSVPEQQHHDAEAEDQAAANATLRAVNNHLNKEVRSIDFIKRCICIQPIEWIRMRLMN